MQNMEENNSKITIVTAFFDIGRGNIPKDKGYPDYLTRTTETYFEYFYNLATLENDMVIFTSPDLKEKIENMRKGKPTKVVTLELDKKFKYILNKINNIQNSDEFKQKISPKQIKNIEYWSNYYVLVTNLKTFFVNLAIEKYTNNRSIENENRLFSWIDFGYVRKLKTLNNVSNWYFPFTKGKINLFSINSMFDIRTENDVYDAVFNNKPYIIGGSIVGDIASWKRFNQIIFNCQKEFIKNNIIDDDQGVFLMSYHKYNDLFHINDLGKDNWFGLFKKFNNEKPSLLQRIINKLK